VVVEKKNAGAVTGKVGNGTKLKANYAGAVTGKVGNGTKLKANLNGRNVHCAGEMGVIAVLTVVEHCCLIKLNMCENIKNTNIIYLLG